MINYFVEVIGNKMEKLRRFKTCRSGGAAM